LDSNPYYGDNEASLTLDEYADWTRQTSSEFTSFSPPSSDKDILPNSRQYSISLSPSVIPATGPLISSLIGSGVSRYGGFRLVEQVAVCDLNGKVKTVPGSKEDVFKDKSISLLDKRRLMRFLVFASAEGDLADKEELRGKGDMPFIEFLKTTFSLNPEISETIAYAMSFCILPSDETLPALHRLRRYLRSSGRYGSSPFLVGHYGSSGEIAQGFCRSAAVAGGVYILGKSISSITRTNNSESRTYSITLSDFPESITCNLIISSENRLPSAPVFQDAEAERKKAKEIRSRFPFPTESKAEAGLGGDNEAVEVEQEVDAIAIVRCICIIDQPLSFAPTSSSSESGSEETEAEGSAASPPTLDTGILVFPPASPGSSAAAVTALIAGEGTMSVPRGKWIIYLSTPVVSQHSNPDPEKLLRPYMEAVLLLSSSSPSTTEASSASNADAAPERKPIVPLFTSFYIQHFHQHSGRSGSNSPLEQPSSDSDLNWTEADSSTATTSMIITPSLTTSSGNPHPLPDVADAAAVNAEMVFWEAVKRLEAVGRTEGELSDSDADKEDADGQIERLWPPIENVDEDE
jgi:Rab proteins geranylgeranyltransferase component A